MSHIARRKAAAADSFSSKGSAAAAAVNLRKSWRSEFLGGFYKYSKISPSSLHLFLCEYRLSVQHPMFPQLPANTPEFKLVLAGDGVGKDAFMKNLKTLPL